MPSAVIAAYYTPPVVAGEAALGAAALTLLRVDVEKERNEEVLRLKQTIPKFFATLWESLSEESREEVSQHAQFLHADFDQDSNVLWIIIRETHLTAIHGVGLGALELVQMKNKFAQLRQKPGLSIGEFKKEFDVQCEVLLGAGIPVTAQPELTILFLDKLDPQCYAGMLAHLTNDVTLGRHLPLTLHTAWSVADGRQLTSRFLKVLTCNLCSFLPTKSQFLKNMQLGEDQSKQNVVRDAIRSNAISSSYIQE